MPESGGVHGEVGDSVVAHSVRFQRDLVDEAAA